MCRRIRTGEMAFLILGALLLSCGDSQTRVNEKRASDAAPVESVVQAQPADSPPPSTSHPTATSPTASTPQGASRGPHDPEAGGVLYAQYCATCHGARGGGDGPVSQGLNPKPAKHHDGHYMNPLSNEHLFKTIKEGGAAVGKSPLMAPWGGALSDEQIWDLVAFVRSLADPPYTGPKP